MLIGDYSDTQFCQLSDLELGRLVLPIGNAIRPRSFLSAKATIRNAMHDYILIGLEGTPTGDHRLGQAQRSRLREHRFCLPATTVRH